MELFFNLLWFALALVALFTVRARRARSHALLALACAALLVFPAISISDDLHVTSAPFEEANKKRLDAEQWVGLSIALPAPAAATGIARPQVSSGEMLSEFVAHVVNPALVSFRLGRDPPSPS